MQYIIAPSLKMNLSKTGEEKAHHLACHDVYCLGVKFYGSNISQIGGYCLYFLTLR